MTLAEWFARLDSGELAVADLPLIRELGTGEELRAIVLSSNRVDVWRWRVLEVVRLCIEKDRGQAPGWLTERDLAEVRALQTAERAPRRGRPMSVLGVGARQLARRGQRPKSKRGPRRVFEAVDRQIYADIDRRLAEGAPSIRAACAAFVDADRYPYDTKAFPVACGKRQGTLKRLRREAIDRLRKRYTRARGKP